MRAALPWLAALAVGIALFFYGGTMDGRSPLAMPMIYASAAIVAGALGMLVISWRASRRRAYAAALQSRDAIARWQVYPADMAEFRAVDAARAGRLWSLSNSLKLPRSVPPEGFPVVVGEETLLVGDKFYDLGMRHFGEPGEVYYQEGKPGFLEISCYLQTTKAPLIVVLRIPVPAAASSEGHRAFAHLAKQVTPGDLARLRSTFADHFEAADQATDAPHRLQRRRKIVLPIVALFILALLAFILYSMARPRPSYLLNETFPIPSNETDLYLPDETYPPLANESDGLPTRPMPRRHRVDDAATLHWAGIWNRRRDPLGCGGALDGKKGGASRLRVFPGAARSFRRWPARPAPGAPLSPGR